ncbi:MAG TPA: hypothetical protein VF008_26850 [Niastella sp.]
MRKFLLFCLCSLAVICVQAQSSYPASVMAILSKAGKNKSELEKALQYFYRQGDPLKIKAIEFLIANMDIHYSADYFWADTNGRQVPFNEFDYPSFTESLQAFDQLKSTYPGLHPVASRRRDFDIVKAEFLIDNVNNAFEVRKNPRAQKLSFAQFCEYILPYRASVEPLQNWRTTYRQKYAWLFDSTGSQSITALLQQFAADMHVWFTNTFEINKRREPLPRLGALQLLHRKSGPCEDIAGLVTFALRSQGYMVANDAVTYWATSTGSHFFNSTLNDSLQSIRFDVSSPAVRFTTFAREPAKVIRSTYSKQSGTLATFEAPSNIPDCFLRSSNYIDVTHEYWETRDVHAQLFPLRNQPRVPRVAYIAVFNGFKWRPTWWGKVKDNATVFTNMCKGAVFLPMYCLQGKMVPAGYPVASGYTNTMVLKPDTIDTRPVQINQQEKYLFFRPGKKYRLFYWNNAWKLAGMQTAAEGATSMTFQGVPRNALLLLVPEYSQGKERPFMITDNNERVWW